jgi:hypothetical protein
MFTIDKNKIDQFSGLILLKKIIQENKSYSVILPEDVSDMKEVFRKLYAANYLELNSDEVYVPTSKGRAAYEAFMNRYSEFIQVYDVYGAVDLEKGVFAMESILDCETAKEWDSYFDDEWDKYLDSEEWEDVIWAVLSYKNSKMIDQIDLVEMAFMTYLREDRFDTSGTAWAFSIQNELIWDEMIEVLNSQLMHEDLGGEDVLDDIIKQGTDLLVSLFEKEDSFEEEVECPAMDCGDFYEDGGEYVVEEIIETYETEYYDSYYDPFYVSPYFVGALIIF